VPLVLAATALAAVGIAGSAAAAPAVPLSTGISTAVAASTGLHRHDLASIVGPPPALVAISGDDQLVPVRQNIEAPIVAVEDSTGLGVPDEPVTFTVSGRAAFADGTRIATVTTDAAGLARSPSLRAASQTGTATITATDGSSTPVAFTVHIISTPPGPRQ